MDGTKTLTRQLPLLTQPVVEACCAPLQTLPLAEAEATELARRFAALSDPVRLRLLNLMATAPDGAMCACDLVEPAGKSQPTVSHHLKILREAGLVISEKRGANVWYAPVPAALEAFRVSDAKALGTLSADSQDDAEHLLGNQVPETIALAAAAREAGAFAASSFGAGFGGSVWALVDTNTTRVEAFAELWRRRHLEQYPAASPVEWFAARPGPAALELPADAGSATG